MASLPPCSEDDLFALFDSALRESLGEREPAAPPLDLDPRTHVCAGSCCPYVVLNEAHTLVCSLTGACHGQAAARNDPFCAGIVQRVDEHGLLKGPVQRFVRRDFLLAQRRAVLLAHELDRMESENPKSAEIKAPVPRPRAVEFLSSASGTRLTGTAARMARGPVIRPELREDALANLRVQAERALDSLTEPAVAVLRERAQKSSIAQTEGPLVPPGAAAYLRRCVLQGQTPSLDTVHNLCLAHEHDCQRRARADALLRDLAARGRGYQARTGGAAGGGPVEVRSQKPFYGHVQAPFRSLPAVCVGRVARAAARLPRGDHGGASAAGAHLRAAGACHAAPARRSSCGGGSCKGRPPQGSQGDELPARLRAVGACSRPRRAL